MIKYIIHTTSSYNDYYGNTYHFARITSTKTGKSLVIKQIGGKDNAAHLLLRRNDWGSSVENPNGKPLVNDWREIYSAQQWEKKREWQRLEKFAQGSDGSKVYEHEVTPTMIRRLNRKSS